MQASACCCGLKSAIQLFINAPNSHESGAFLFSHGDFKDFSQRSQWQKDLLF
jgi:hypothetical protein